MAKMHVAAWSIVLGVTTAWAGFDGKAADTDYVPFAKKMMEEQWPGHYLVKDLHTEERDLASADWDKLFDAREGLEGKITFNPRMQGKDFATMAKRMEVVTLPRELEGAHMSKVAAYVWKTYAADYEIPGVEFLRWLADHPDAASDALKSAMVVWCVGSLAGLPVEDDG